MKSVYGCIYAVWNPDRSHVYIGQTTKTPAERWVRHMKNARANKGCPRLGAAIRKYGDQMIVEPLDVAECQADLDFLETFYICVLDAIKQGYNCQAGGGGGRLLDEDAKERRRAGVRTGLSKMTDEERAIWRENSRAAVRVTMARQDVRARVSAGAKAGLAKMTKEKRAAWRMNNNASVKIAMACHDVRTRISANNKIRWAREEENGRVLRSPEKRERRRLWMQAYRARRRAEKEGVTA